MWSKLSLQFLTLYWLLKSKNVLGCLHLYRIKDILVEAGHILEYGEKIVRRVKQNLFNGEYNETGKPKNRTRQIFDRFQLFYRTTVSAQETVFEAVKQIIDTD